MEIGREIEMLARVHDLGLQKIPRFDSLVYRRDYHSL
jgi:hypothetical protein